MTVVGDEVRSGGPGFEATVTFAPTQDDASYRSLLALLFAPVVADERVAP